MTDNTLLLNDGARNVSRSLLRLKDKRKYNLKAISISTSEHKTMNRDK